MYSKALIISLLLLIVTSACSKKSSSNKRETPIEEQEIQAVMNNQKFDCASLGGECPAGVTRIFILDPADPQRSAVCSGFMVSPTRLVTNHHCVSTPSECANTYLAIYDGLTYQQAKCRSIVVTVQDTPDPNDRSRKLDFTVMDITVPYNGEFFSMSQIDASAGDRIHSWVVDHTGLDKFPPNLTDARITEFECEVKNQNEWASMFMMNCPIISGNSGSPALNTRGEVVGVIWGGSSSTVDSSMDLDDRRALDEVGLATEAKYFRDFGL